MSETATTENLTDRLAGMIWDLQGHIERRAQEIAEPRIAEAQRIHEATANNIMAKAAADEQRLNDLAAELRRQVDAQVRRAERAEAERDDFKITSGRIERLRDKWLTYPQNDMHYAAGLMLDRHLSGEAFAADEGLRG